MAFKKVEAPKSLPWKPEKDGDLIEGALVQVRHDVGPNKSIVYTIENKNGRFDFFGSTVLDDLMRSVEVGDIIQVKYRGMRKNYHVFEVFKDDGED